MRVSDMFEEGYVMGARHVIEFFENRLYRIPDSWKIGYGKAIFVVLELSLESAKSEYLGGSKDGK